MLTRRVPSAAIAAFLFVSAAHTAEAQGQWDTRFDTLGMNDTVYAVAANDTDVYAGGGFTTAGGVPANRVAKWDGTTWSALGSGVEGGDVSALAVSGSDVYVAGSFTTAGGLPANGIAKWDGATWSALGAGISGGSRDLVVSGANVYATTVNGVSRWNGTTWSALGTGLPTDLFGNPTGLVVSLAVMGTDVYAVGLFTMMGGVPAQNIAKWNGTSWSALGSGLVRPISTYHIAGAEVIGTDLYVAGHFLNAGGVDISWNGVAKWDGTSWSGVGAPSGATGGFLGIPGSFGQSDAGIYVATINVSGNTVWNWDGNAWSLVGRVGPVGGIDVFSITSVRKSVYLGGQFADVGCGSDQAECTSIPSFRIAAWHEHDCGNTIEEIGETCDDGNLVNCDGCSAECVEETGCADGVTCGAEECDDGNVVDGDGCTATCEIQVCGNTIEEAGEECDDGNPLNGDSCTMDCEDAVYGDADGDGVPEDGDGSLFLGDLPCFGPGTGCDDNCPWTANAGQQDTDADGVGDACDNNCRSGLGGTAALAGTVYRDTAVPANELPYALVWLRGTTNCWDTLVAGNDGTYLFDDLIPDTYAVEAQAPGGENLISRRLDSLVLTSGQTSLGNDLALRTPLPPPLDTFVEDHGSGLEIETQGCAGGTATFEVRESATDALVASGSLVEGPAGTYSGALGALAGGPKWVTVEVVCPNLSVETTEFTQYIDPSGYILFNDGVAAIGATVSLYRADVSTGPFVLVPNGSAIMAPKNRVNPDTSVAEGRFGWDVIPGYYIVRATNPLCDAESEVMNIPPEVTELPVVLDCSSLCGNGLRATCKTAAKASLQINDNAADDSKDKLGWKWTNGAETSFVELGEPNDSAAYALCVYGDGGASLLFDTYVPASADRWQIVGTAKGHKYTDKTGVSAGAQKISLKSGSSGKATMSFRGRGANLPDATLASFSLPVIGMLANSQTSACFESRFEAGGVSKNTIAQFKAKAP